MKILLASLAVASLALSSAALAQDTGAILPDQSFSGVDTDRNGMVSWTEFSLVYTDINEMTFDAADLDGDGFLNEDEFSSLVVSTGSVNRPASTGVPAATQSLTYEPPLD